MPKGLVDDRESRSIEQFDAWASRFDRRLGWAYSRSSRHLLRLLDPPSGSSVLDVGCGTGILLEQLARLDRDLRLFGIDISSAMLEVARAKVTGGLLALQQGSASALPYSSLSFDLVTCTTSFHHYPDFLLALSEMRRVLKPEGQLLLFDPFTDGFARRAICTALNTVAGEKDTHLFTAEQMNDLFREAGFGRITQRPYSCYKLITIAIK